MAVSRDDLRRFLEGHRAADRVLRRESLRRLRFLTEAESRAEYDALCRTWEASGARADQGGLDRRAIAERVALRRRFAGKR
jgi:hypothetical protein